MALQTEDPPTQVPDTFPEAFGAPRAQARFEWTVIALALTALVSVLALVVGFGALSQNATHTSPNRPVTMKAERQP